KRGRPAATRILRRPCGRTAVLPPQRLSLPPYAHWGILPRSRRSAAGTLRSAVGGRRPNRHRFGSVITNRLRKQGRRLQLLEAPAGVVALRRAIPVVRGTGQ